MTSPRPPSWPANERRLHWAGRVACGVAGVIVALVAVWGSLAVLLIGSYAGLVPDPSIPGGDPCCGHPDTWNEVYVSVAAGVVAAFVDGGVLALAVGLLYVAFTGRPARLKRLLLIPVATAVLAFTVMAAVMIPNLGKGEGEAQAAECRPVNNPEQIGRC